MSVITINSEQMFDEVEECIKAKLTPYITSSPGMAKSSIVQEVAKKHKLKLIDIRLSQCTPEDLQGFPVKSNGKADFIPFSMFPLETDSIPENYNGWLILLDELSSASKSVQAAAYKLILDKMVGNYKLHKNVAMVACGNKATDNAVVVSMSTALQSRLVHYELQIDYKAWLTWAVKNQINSKIIGFINFKPNLLMNFIPDHTDRTFACPRTWEYLSKLLKNIPEVSSKYTARIVGTIGTGAGMEFINFCELFMHLPKYEDIIKNPLNIAIPELIDIQYAITSMLVDRVSETDTKQVFTYINRFPTEFKIVFIEQYINKMKDTKSNELKPEIMKLVMDFLEPIQGIDIDV
jgi:hypothetical protein